MELIPDVPMTTVNEDQSFLTSLSKIDHVADPNMTITFDQANNHATTQKISALQERVAKLEERVFELRCQNEKLDSYNKELTTDKNE
jgi:polyhydroxyalkanoate synthesis regulator phasin